MIFIGLVLIVAGALIGSDGLVIVGGLVAIVGLL